MSLFLFLTLLLHLLQTPVTPGEPLGVTLTAYAGPADLTYTAAGPERVAITARSQADTPVDVTLAVLNGARLLAFDDDGGAALPGLLLPTDAHIPRLDLPGAGVYTLRLNSFSGAQSGPLEVTLTRLPLAACAPQQTVTLVRGDVFRCTLELPAGARLTVTARDADGALNPVLALYGPDGARTAWHDDGALADVRPAQAGVYTLALAEFTGADGILTLTVEILS